MSPEMAKEERERRIARMVVSRKGEAKGEEEREREKGENRLTAGRKGEALEEGTR